MIDSGQTSSRFCAHHPGEAKETWWFLWQPTGGVTFIKCCEEQKQGRRQPRQSDPRSVSLGSFVRLPSPSVRTRTFPPDGAPDGRCRPPACGVESPLCHWQKPGGSLCQGVPLSRVPQIRECGNRGKAPVHCHAFSHEPGSPVPRGKSYLQCRL